MAGRGEARRRASGIGVIVLMLTAATGVSYGQTTVDQRIGGGDRTQGFSLLEPRPGEPYVVREDGLGTAQAGREARRQSLLSIAHLSDFQLADEESPARVEFVDMTANPPLPGVFNAAQRPQEALVPQAAAAGIDAVNDLAAGPVGGRPFDLTLFTGDLADSQQYNEALGVRTLLEGGVVDPNSGKTNKGCPPGTPGAAEAARYTGVQDRDDYLEGAHFYDPDRPDGQYATWPRWPGLMDRAQRSFVTQGLNTKSYVAFGNHDGLVQGNAAALAPYELVGLGCVKPMAPAFNPFNPQSALAPTYLSGLLQTSPGRVALVPRDPDRRYLDHRQFKQLFMAGEQADGHGFGAVEAAENTASRGHAGYYAFLGSPNAYFIGLDTVSEGGVPGPSANGNIDDPQWRWLQRQLAISDQLRQAGIVTIVFGHHPIRSLNSPVPDELALPCIINDVHGHGLNPGCDRDPRSSTPIHDGEELKNLLLAHPGVVATVFGHTHESKVTPFARPGGGGFWAIESPSHIDWPIQSRTIELMDNNDGTLSIFGTLFDSDAPVQPPPSGANASAFSEDELASIARTIAYNDHQAGGSPTGNGSGEGAAIDRNVELIVADPRP